MIKVGLKYLKRFILGVLLLIIAYVLTAFLLSIIPTNPDPLSCEKDKMVFVTTNGIHLDLILPAAYLNETFRQELQAGETVAFLSFGWGDKQFYLETPTWQDLKFGTALRAIFLNSEAAMHVTYLQRKQDKWIKLPVCASQLELLMDYIIQSFRRNEQGKIMEIVDSGYTSYDKFFDANGNFNSINTCNEWVNKGLKRAKIKTSIWSPFDKGVLYQRASPHENTGMDHQKN